MKKILFIMLIGLLLGCSRETEPIPEVDVDATIEAWVGIELEEEKPEPTATTVPPAPTPEPTATTVPPATTTEPTATTVPPAPTPEPAPEYSLNLEFSTKKYSLYDFVYLNDFNLEILNSGGQEEGDIKAKWTFYNRENLLTWEKEFDLKYIEGSTKKTLDGKKVNFWLSPGKYSWPFVQVIVPVQQRLYAKSYLSINGGENIPLFEIIASQY